MEEDLDYFSKNNASQPKKRKCKTKRNRTIKHGENKIQKLSNNHFLQRDQEGRLVGSFFFDIDVLTTKNIDPFPLERKIFDVKIGR